MTNPIKTYNPRGGVDHPVKTPTVHDFRAEFLGTLKAGDTVSVQLQACMGGGGRLDGKARHNWRIGRVTKSKKYGTIRYRLDVPGEKPRPASSAVSLHVRPGPHVSAGVGNMGLSLMWLGPAEGD